MTDARPTARDLALVAAGGSIGTAARYGLADGWARLLVGVWLLGSFATFSTFAVEIAGLAATGAF